MCQMFAVSALFAIYGLPDPTAALEAYSAAGGCPLSVLLEHFAEPFDPFTFMQLPVSFIRATSPRMAHSLH